MLTTKIPFRKWLEALLPKRFQSSSKNEFTELNTDEFKNDVTISMVESAATDISETDESPEMETPVDEQDAITAWEIALSFAEIIFSKENRPDIIAAGVMIFINTGLKFIAPYLMGVTFDALNQQRKPEIAGQEFDPMVMVLMLVTAGTLARVIPNFRDILLAPVAAKSNRKLIATLGEHQIKQSLEYHTKTPMVEQSYLIQKAAMAGYTTPSILTQIIPTLFETIMSIGILSYRFDPVIGVSLAGMAAVYTGFNVVTTKPVIKAKESWRLEDGVAWGALGKTIEQYKNIHDFVHASKEMKQVYEDLNKAAQKEYEYMILNTKVGFGQILIPKIYMLMACLFVMKGIESGQYNAQEFILLFSYLDSLSSLIPSIGYALSNMLATYPDLKFVFGYLKNKSNQIDGGGGEELKIESPPGIRFENVKFGYKNKPLFDNLSFEVKGGQTVAFVSQSGGGKSSLFKLLYRYDDPESGTIYINDQDIKTLKRESLQKAISMVTQNPVLKNESIRDNIKYGAEDPDSVTDEDIWKLAREINLDGFLCSFDRGYEVEVSSTEPRNKSLKEGVIMVYLGDNNEPCYAFRKPKTEKGTENLFIFIKKQINQGNQPEEKQLSEYYHKVLSSQCSEKISQDSVNALLDLLLSRKEIEDNRLGKLAGESGRHLSGGEQQRIAILRALLKPSSIRLFDEVTSALDGIASQKIIEGIRKFTQGQTKLMVTHKLSESRFADKIIVLDKGKIVGQGAHDELLHSCSLYKELWDKQNTETEVSRFTGSTTRRILAVTGVGEHGGDDEFKIDIKPQDNAASSHSADDIKPQVATRQLIK